ncbi:MAG: HAD-IC family P-type ATPase [Candidatus Thermoplasmatota archaeon]|nr:HAD-IC family P-type ATPase [Candidatus Thermoplasmatota archaeon]
MKGKNDYYQMSVQETLDDLDTTTEGLSRDKAEDRLDKYGKNELTGKVQTPKLLLFLSQFKELLVVVLIVAGIVSLFLGISQNDPGSLKSAAAMFIIVVINAVIGFIQKYKAEQIIQKLKSLIKSPAQVKQDGKWKEIDQEELVPGDIIKVEEGDKIPADIRIIKSFNLKTNDFSLTGESMPQEKHSNAIKEEVTLADRDNMAYVGTTVATGNGTGVVIATGMETEMGKIADMTEETSELKSPLQKELNLLAKHLTSIVVVISVALFGVAMWQDLGLTTSLLYAVGIAVSAVPQALPAQVTVALSTGSNRLANKNAVVKNLSSVETLGSTTVICTDKTGTLTKNEMTVKNIWFDGEEYSLTGLGYKPEGTIEDEDGNELSQEEISKLEILMDAATMSSSAEIHEPDDQHDSWYAVGDPTEAALVTMSTKLGTRHEREDEENPEVVEFPFDSERKRMSSVRDIGESYEDEKVKEAFEGDTEGMRVLAMKGATDSILSISKYIYSDGEVRDITEEDKKKIRELNEKYSKKAMRVLAMAYRPLEKKGEDYIEEEVEKDVIFLGLAAMIDPPKEGVEEAIESCHDAHIRTYIMTGDHAITARAVGEEIGLFEENEEPLVVTGKEMKDIGDEELKEMMEDKSSMIFSRVDPEDKLRIVKLLEDEDEIVAVTGDGVNDAPALKRAHIGVAMGQKGTDVAKEASELVLLDDSFPTLVHAVREGRTIYNNLKKTVLASMTTNGAELTTVLAGLAAIGLLGWSEWAIPILVIQILAIDLLAEIMPLTFLAYDPPSEEMMTSPPRSREEHILNLPRSVEVIFLGLLIGSLAAGNFWLYFYRQGLSLTGSKLPEYAAATTISYLTLAYCQFANIMSRRYEYDSIFSKNFFSNKIIVYSIIASIGLVFLGVYGPYISNFLAFASIGLMEWLQVLGAMAIFLGVFEIIKLIKRLKR